MQAPVPCGLSSVYVCVHCLLLWRSAGLWLCLGGCSWALSPTQQLHTGSIEAGTFLAACVTVGEGAGPAPTDPEGLAAPGGGAGRFPAHLEVMTLFLLPGGATDVSSHARPGIGARCAKIGKEAAQGEGEPQNRGSPTRRWQLGSRQRR